MPIECESAFPQLRIYMRGAYVAFEGFVLYAGGDYTLYPNIMLLVQVMVYVMSGMFASEIVG